MISKKATLLLAGCMLAAMTALVGTAAGDLGTHVRYSGGFDDAPQSLVRFSVNFEKKKVNDFNYQARTKAFLANLSCKGGEVEIPAKSIGARFEDTKIENGRRFKTVIRRKGPIGTGGTFSLVDTARGALSSGGHARGTVRLRVRYNYPQGKIRCDTGYVDWRAEQS